MAELTGTGWVPCGVGDWAVALRSPDGTVVADDAHIFRAADGRPVLIDVFCMAGAELYRAILEDVAEVHRRIPRERMRYALETRYIARENSTAEILALRGQFITRLSRGSGFFRRTQVQRSSRPATASTTHRHTKIMSASTPASFTSPGLPTIRSATLVPEISKNQATP